MLLPWYSKTENTFPQKTRTSCMIITSWGYCSTKEA